MHSQWAQAEAERTSANMLRLGVISELDAKNARVKVKIGELTTTWIPWTTSRAGATRTWSAPRPGEQVLVISPFGDFTQGVVSSSIYQKNHPAPADSEDDETIDFPDGSFINYNSKTNTLTVTVSNDGNVIINCKKATINADTSVTLNAPKTEINSNIKVNGNADFSGGSLKHNGKNVGDSHKHADPQGGSTGAPL